MTSDVTLEAKDKFAALTKTKAPDVQGFGIRVDRGLKIFTMGIPSSIATIFNIDSMPTFVIDFGKGRLFVTINFRINEGSKAANETEFMDWSNFVRSFSFKADHLYLKIGAFIKSIGEPLTDSSKGIEGKVLRFVAHRNSEDDLIYCTLMFVHCVELNII